MNNIKNLTKRVGEEEKIKKLKSHKKFISLIIEKGLPQMPDKNSEGTYKSRLAELCGKSNDLFIN